MFIGVFCQINNIINNIILCVFDNLFYITDVDYTILKILVAIAGMDSVWVCGQLQGQHNAALFRFRL